MEAQTTFKKLSKRHSDKMLILIRQLNPDIENEVLKQRLEQMWESDAYQCFGLLKKDTLIGLIGCWTFTKLHSGKQLELDNVIIDERIQSKGYGKLFFNFIADWALKNGYESLGLNTYVDNDKSHKFYFNQGFKILGFHFQKILTTK